MHVSFLPIGPEYDEKTDGTWVLIEHHSEEGQIVVSHRVGGIEGEILNKRTLGVSEADPSTIYNIVDGYDLFAEL